MLHSFVPEYDPNAPATSMDRCTSGQEQEQGRAKHRAKKGAKEAHKAQQPTQTREEEEAGRPAKDTTGHKGQVATTGGGAGKAEEDRAEEAAHITLE